jgi:hypothetical protein
VARKKAWNKAKAKALKVVEAAKKAAKAAKDMMKKQDLIKKLNKIMLQEGKKQVKEQGNNSTGNGNIGVKLPVLKLKI